MKLSALFEDTLDDEDQFGWPKDAQIIEVDYELESSTSWGKARGDTLSWVRSIVPENDIIGVRVTPPAGGIGYKSPQTWIVSVAIHADNLQLSRVAGARNTFKHYTTIHEPMSCDEIDDFVPLKLSLHDEDVLDDQDQFGWSPDNFVVFAHTEADASQTHPARHAIQLVSDAIRHIVKIDRWAAGANAARDSAVWVMGLTQDHRVVNTPMFGQIKDVPAEVRAITFISAGTAQNYAADFDIGDFKTAAEWGIG